MSESLRIAILVDPLTLRAKGGDHPAAVAAELLGRGHVVRGFGALPGEIPRSGATAEAGGQGRGSDPLRRFRPDVLLAYDALSPSAALGARVARRTGGALVLVQTDASGGGRLHERLLWRVGELLWGRYVRRTASAVVALDPLERERALRQGFADARVSVLPRGVDLTRFRPGLTSGLVAEHRIRGRILLYVGRIEPASGLDTLIAAFERTVGQRHDWTLVLAGEGSARPRLRAMCERLGISGNVHWLRRPRTAELPGLMGAATLLAVPALDDAARGTQIPRALACGLPVLASDLSRFCHLVLPEETGLLAPPGDLEAWSETIQRAASAPMARERWAHRARELAEERLGWPAIARDLEALFVEARSRASVAASVARSGERHAAG